MYRLHRPKTFKSICDQGSAISHDTITVSWDNCDHEGGGRYYHYVSNCHAVFIWQQHEWCRVGEPCYESSRSGLVDPLQPQHMFPDMHH